jgi:hypothetical protein
MAFSFPKKSLVLCGCVTYLAGALLWGLREREQLQAEAELLAACRETPAAPGMAQVKREGRLTRANMRPVLGTPHMAVPEEPSWRGEARAVSRRVRHELDALPGR